MIARLTGDGMLTVEDAGGVVARWPNPMTGDRRTRRLWATRALRAAGYGELGPWQTGTDEATGVRTVGRAPC